MVSVDVLGSETFIGFRIGRCYLGRNLPHEHPLAQQSLPVSREIWEFGRGPDVGYSLVDRKPFLVGPYPIVRFVRGKYNMWLVCVAGILIKYWKRVAHVTHNL